MPKSLFARLLLSGALAALSQLSVSAATTPAVVKLALINTTAQKELRALTGGSTVILAQDGSALNVRADVSGTVGSVGFVLDGKLFRTENVAPYAMAGDTDGDYYKWTPTTGSHTLRVTAYTSDNRKGTASSTVEVKFSVLKEAPASAPEAQPKTEAEPKPAGLSISELTLINAAKQKALRTLEDGDIIVFDTDGSALNVRADVSGKAGSVAFYLDGKLFSTENVAPYALGLDDSGVYRKWTPSIGSHTLRVTPYSGSNRTGTAGATTEIEFTVQKELALEEKLESSPPVPGLPSLSSILYGVTGQLNQALYGTLALSYDKATMETRLGPSFADLSPKAADDRPNVYLRSSKSYSKGYIRVNPYELGAPVKDGDYWSDAGQVGYIPEAASDPGLDRIQTYAYYDHVFAISPRLDWTGKTPHPELQTREPFYATLFGEAPRHPIAMVRNYGQQCNEALVLYRDGYLGVAGTQTSRTNDERPYPGFVFPAHKVPTGIATTTGNEFALVTIWDIQAKKGQLAVLALEGKYLPFHTWPYMGMQNQGSWSAFKLLGYVDLPMKTPTSVSAASNGWWSGPSQTGNKVLSQIDIGKESDRKNLYTGSWTAVVAKAGYAIVASQYDNKACIVDMTALFTYMRESYLSSAESYKRTLAARGLGDSQFPQAFSVNASIKPQVIWETDVATPTCVLAGMKLDRWTKDHFKAYIAARDGTIQIIDTSSIMARASWDRVAELRVVGSFNVGRNPVSMCFTRRRDSKNFPLLPKLKDGTQAISDPLNNLFYVAVRGDRKVVGVVTFEGKGAIYRTIKDKRMGDPVAVSTAVRGPILSVADFRGKKIISYRIGTIKDNRNGKSYGPGADGKAEFECAGELPVAGYPFLVNSTNVN
jgi:hypothetical protein